MVGGIVAVVMGPGASQKRVAQTQAEQHPPARINEYEAPPPAQDLMQLASNSLGAGSTTRAAGANTAPPRRRCPPPTEMALYAPNGAARAGGAAAARGTAADEAAAGQDPSGRPLRAGADPADPLAASVSGATVLPATHATLVRNADFTIRAGDVIPCLPVDAQNSSRPGFTTCKVPEWFRSSNQRRGLLPPGTRIFGQIRSGISQGERRLGVLYTQIQTPRFNVAVAAPAADPFGRAGLDGDVETFFWTGPGPSRCMRCWTWRSARARTSPPRRCPAPTTAATAPRSTSAARPRASPRKSWAAASTVRRC